MEFKLCCIFGIGNAGLKMILTVRTVAFRTNDIFVSVNCHIGYSRVFRVERCTIWGGSFKYYILYFIQPIILYIGLNNTIVFLKRIISLYGSLHQLFFLNNQVLL